MPGPRPSHNHPYTIHSRAGHARPPTAQYTKRHLLNPEQVPFYIPLFRISASFFAKKEQNFRIPRSLLHPVQIPVRHNVIRLGQMIPHPHLGV